MGAATLEWGNGGSPVPVRRRATVAATAIAAAGGVACSLSFAAPAIRGLPLHPLDETVHIAVAASYIGAGVIALVRRPDNGIGYLMALVGFLWLVGDLGWIAAPLPFTISVAYSKLYQPAIAHLFLAFPSGRLRTRLLRVAVASVYVWTVANNTVFAMFDDPRTDGCRDCPRNLLLVSDSVDAKQTISDVTTWISIALVAGAVALVIHQWQTASRAARRAMAPVLWATVPAAAYIAMHELADLVSLSPGANHVVYDVLPIGLVALPIGFLVALLRTRLSYAQVATLLPELASGVAPGRVRDALARALHDPELELFYWSPSAEEYVDLDGQARSVEPGSGRAVARIDGESGPLAAMLVDIAVLDEPALVDAAGAMARLALENERLQAEVRSQLVQLRATTQRLVEAGQDARRRIERDLHDGAQQRLLSLAMTLGQARARVNGNSELRDWLGRASDDVQQAITELRELARGIHPMLLTQQGLASALEALAERAPVPVTVHAPFERFAESVETTAYYAVAEAVTNAARHSQASAITVDVRYAQGELTVLISDDGVGGAASNGAGTGLQGIHDRVVAVGGRVSVDSRPGAGTTILVRLPCE